MSETAAWYDQVRSENRASVAPSRWAYAVGSVAAGFAFASTIEALREALIGTWIFEQYSQGDFVGAWSAYAFAALYLSVFAFRRRLHSNEIGLGSAAIAYLILQWVEASAWASCAVAVIAIGIGRRLLPQSESAPRGYSASAEEVAESDRRFQGRAGYQFSTLLYRFPLGAIALMAAPTVYFYTAGFESTRASILAALGVGVALGGAIPVPKVFANDGRWRLLGVAAVAAVAVFVLDATLRAATSELFRAALPFAEADPRIAELALCFVLLFPFAVAGGWIGSIWRGFSPAEVAAARNDGLPGAWVCIGVFGALSFWSPREAWIPVMEGMMSRNVDVSNDRVERRFDVDRMEFEGWVRSVGSSVTIRNGMTDWQTPASSHTIDALRAVAGPRSAWTDAVRGIRWRGELRTVDGYGWSGLAHEWNSSGPIEKSGIPEWPEPAAHELCRAMLPSTLAWEDLDHVWARWLATRSNVGGVQVMRFLDLAATPPNRVVKSLVPDAAQVSVMLVFAGACGPFVVVTDADPKPALRERGAWLPLLTQREFAAHEWPDEALPNRRPWNPIASHVTLDAMIALLERDPAEGERTAAAGLLKALAIHRDQDAGSGAFLDVSTRHVFTEAEAAVLVSAIERAPTSHVVARQCRWLVELALDTATYSSMRDVLDALRRYWPADLEVERTAARYFGRAGDAGAALASWDRVVEADPKDIRAKIELARALFDTGAEEAARALAESVRPQRATRVEMKHGDGGRTYHVGNVSPHACRFGLLLLHMARNEEDEAEAFGYLSDGMESFASAGSEARAAYEKLRTKRGAAAPK